MTQGTPTLRRSLGPATVTVYGIGTIIGAGIFVLLGKLIGVAGPAAPMAFALATLIAGLTGISYARLAARLPYSAGEAIYVETAFSRRWLTLLVGLGVAGSGILSAATIAHGFAGYLNVLVAVPAKITAVVYLVALGGIAIIGIRETAWVVGMIAVSSTMGLIAVAVMIVQGHADWHWPELHWGLNPASLTGLLLGAFLAFYALIGFEDLVNLAEEIENPGRTLGIAIPVALGFSALLYIGLAIVALGAAPVDKLAATEAPMAFLLDEAGLPGQTLVVILSIVAITEGALAQLVMAARVLYGLAGRGLLPAAMRDIHPRTRTPLVASLAVLGLVVLAVSSGDVMSLARGTSALVLTVFTLVNLALIVIIRHEGQPGMVKILLPLLAALSCLGLLGAEALRLMGVIQS